MNSELIEILNSTHSPEVSLDPEEVWRCLGPAGSARDSLQEEVVRSAEEAASVSVPMAVSCALQVESAGRGAVRFDNGSAVEGKMLPHIFEGADGAVFMIATAGSGVEARANEYFAEGEHVAGIVLDAAGTAIAINAFEQTLAQLTWELQQREIKVGPAISPGTETWSMEGQRTMFDVLPTAEIGVTLLDSLMMSPQKSQSKIIPFGRELHLVNDPDSAPCRTCRAKRCPMRIEEYAGQIGE